MAPNIANPMMNPTRLVTEKARIRNRCSGSTGSLARRSTRTNTPTRTTPATPRIQIGAEFHA